MRTYRTNEIAFDLPDAGFVDLTMHDLQAGLPGGHSLGMMVVREALPEGKGLREAVDDHAVHEAKRLWGYRSLGVRDVTIAGLEAVETFARWVHAGVELYTREAHLARDGVRLTLAATAPLEHRELCDACVDRALVTLSFP